MSIYIVMVAMAKMLLAPDAVFLYSLSFNKQTLSPSHSVSSVCRSLWSLRNYIHIQLCVSLVIAQLVFVIGVEPRGNEVILTN